MKQVSLDGELCNPSSWKVKLEDKLCISITAWKTLSPLEPDVFVTEVGKRWWICFIWISFPSKSRLRFLSYECEKGKVPKSLQNPDQFKAWRPKVYSNKMLIYFSNCSGKHMAKDAY